MRADSVFNLFRKTSAEKRISIIKFTSSYSYANLNQYLHKIAYS